MRYASLVLGFSLLFSACGGDGGGDLVAPTTGSLELRTTTTGDTDTEGYTVSLDGGTPEPIGLNATVTRTELAPGVHVVTLSGLAVGCTVSGTNPRSITVTAGETTIEDFAITCVPPVGTIRVTTATTGPGPASYELLLDGTSQGSIGSASARTLENIGAGSHLVGLSALPANCQIQGDNPRAAAVTIGAIIEISFAVICTAPPAETGSINISVATTGPVPDPDGYQIVVDGGTPQPVGLQGSILLTNVAVGDHTVQLTGLASNCTLSGPNPQSVTLIANATVTVSFAVQCGTPAPTTGTLRIVTATTGSDVDADGYTYSVDNQAPQPIGVSATATVDNVAAGPHSVALAGLATNCTVQGANPQSVTIMASATAEVSFAIACTVPTVRQWTRMTSGTDATLHAVWAGAATNVYAVGVGSSGSLIIRYDGEAWAQQLSHGGTLNGVWGSAPNDVFAVGGFGSFEDTDGVLLHFNGSGWSEMQGPSKDDVSYDAVWGSSATDVFAVGSSFDFDYMGLIAHYDGNSWSEMTLPTVEGRVLRDVHGTSARDVWAVGFAQFAELTPDGVVLHYDGSAWTEPFGVGEFVFSGVWANAPDDVFAVGGTDEVAAIYHYHGQSWSPMAIPPTAGLRDVWGTSSTDVYAVGISTILHYDGTSWTEVRHAQPTFHGVWGSSSTDVFVVGSNGTIFHGTP